MDTESRSGKGHICQIWDPDVRSLCNPGEPAGGQFLLPGVTGADIPCRCSDNGLEQDRCICISADSPHTISDRQDRAVFICGNTNGTPLAQEVVVAQVVGPTGGGPDSATGQSRPVTTVEGIAMAPGLRQVESGGLETERERLSHEGFSEEVINTMQCSVRGSTKKVYDRQWKQFADWCGERHCDPCSASVSIVCAFLQYLFNKGAAYRTIAVFRSALSKYHVGVDGKPIGQNLRVCKFLKGVFNKRPPIRSLIPSWNLEVVLRALQREPFEPLKTASVCNCTLKTMFLVVMASARRCSELASLGRAEPYLRVEAGGY